MVIKLIPPGVSPTIVALAPGTETRLGDMAADVRISGTRLVQTIALFRAAAIKNLSRLNRQTTVTFRTTRLHETLAAALEFGITHETALVNAQGDIRITAATGSLTGWLLQNAVVVSAETQQIGLTTISNYQCVGGAVTTWTAP